MKKKSIAVLIVMFLIMLSGCGNDKNSAQKGENTNLFKSNLPCTIRQSMSIKFSYSDIEKEYGNAKVKRNSDNNPYEIRNMSDSSKIITIYDIETNRLVDIWRIKKLFLESDFDIIKINVSTSEDVKKIDPYAFIFECDNDKAISEHKLKDNKAAVITYHNNNNKWIVEKIEFQDDLSNLAKTLSKEDLESLTVK